jgi:hypothetical protein
MSEPQRVPSWLSWVLLVAAVGVLADGVLLAGFHLRDLYAAHHIPGIWMALAWYANHGVFYPPLEEAGYYGGTRYMPLFFLLVAGLARLTASYLVAAKLASAAGVALLVAGVAAAGRRLTGRFAAAVVLGALVLAVPQGLQAVLLPHVDALAAALSVWGLLVVETNQDPFRIGWAALLFTLALAAKFTTVAGLGAALVWLLLRNRRAALWLLVLVLALCGAGLGLMQVLSGGRFLDTLGSVGGGGLDWNSIKAGPGKVFHILAHGQGFLVLLPLALVSLTSRLRPFRLDLWDWNLLATCGTALVILTAPGTADNHLIEVETAAIIVCGHFLAGWGRQSPGDLDQKTDVSRSPVRLLGQAVLLVVLLLCVRFHVGTWQANETDGVIPVQALVEALPAGQPILGETPVAAVLLGQRPVVLDAYSFRVLAARGRINDRALAGRLDRQEFAALVLLGRIDKPHESLCPDQHFGPAVTEAMLRHYRFDRQVGAFYLYVPATP